MISKRLKHIATGVALTSYGCGARNSYRVGAILFKKNKIITAKTNSLKTHPALAKFTPYPYLHAESACILSHGIDNCQDLNMLVVRVYRDNKTLSCAKPCKTCNELIQLTGIRKVFYTNWHGGIECYDPRT